MTDDRGHQEQMEQELMDMIERLIAGETVGAVGARDEEQEKLLALAAELGAPDAAPPAARVARLDRGRRGAVRAPGRAQALPSAGEPAPMMSQRPPASQ